MTKMNKRTYLPSLLLHLAVMCAAMQATAQDTLSLETAIQTALQNNYGIQVARLSSEIAENNAHPGQAGLLPSVSAGAGYTYSNSAVQVSFSSPAIPEVDASGVVNQNNNGSLGITYRLFGGFGAANTYKVLRQSAALSREQTRAAIENTLTQVIGAYYEVARLSGAYRISRETVTVSRESLGRVQNQREFGSANRLAVLNAEVDLNTDSVNMETALLNLENARQNLLSLIGDDSGRAFFTTRAVTFISLPQVEALLPQAIEQNAQVKVAEYNQRIAELNLRVAEAGRYPTLDLSSSYGFNNANNGPGNILKTQNTLGFTGGASLNFNLFNGSRTRTSIENAQVSIASSKAQYDDALRTLRRDLENALRTYRNSLKIIELEQKSLLAAELNFQSSEERYRLGQLDNVAFRTAQLNLIQTQNRLNDLRYAAKLTETEILRLSGQLLEE